MSQAKPNQDAPPANSGTAVAIGFGFGDLLGGVPMVTLKDGSRAPEYMVCEKCGAHLNISPNPKGAFSYQSCHCDEPEWMQHV